MVFHSFKRMFIKYNVQKRLVIFSTLQSGHQLDFIVKGTKDTINCLFDLNFFLHPDESLKEIECIIGDQSLYITDIILDKRQFFAKILYGTADTVSTFLCRITTQTNRIKEFIVLVNIYNSEQSCFPIKQRENNLWIASQDPDIHYRQENGKEWIDGDMVVNTVSFCLWRYRNNKGNAEWIPMLALNEIAQPITILFPNDTLNVETEEMLDQLCSDKGKIKSDGNGGLVIDGDLYSNKFHTHSIVSGDPMGSGGFFSTPGLLSGQSLYVASPEAQPKNMYVGVNGVVSTKMLSADYLQLALISTTDLPTTVKIGTLVVCSDYKGFSFPVLLCALKDEPQSVEDWKMITLGEEGGTLSSHGNHPQLLEIAESPTLYPVDIQPSIMADNVVQIPSAFSSKHKVEGVQGPERDSQNISLARTSCETFTHIEFDAFSLPPSEGRSVAWNKLHPLINNNKIKGEGYSFWQVEGDYWQVPSDGLLHVQGWFIFGEEEMNQSAPISYHAGDLLFLNIGRNLDQNIPNEIITQLEFSLFPYINDVTHCVCANQRLPFTLSYPVYKGDKISFELSYIQQRKSYSQYKELQVKNAVFQIYMT